MKVTPRRILYYIPIAWWGGSQRYVYDLAREAAALGHEVLVATGEGELAERLEAAEIPVAISAHHTRGIGASELQALHSLMGVMRAFRPDVLHANNSKGGLWGAIAGRLMGVRRIVFTAHGWAFNEERPWWQKVVFWIAHYTTVLLSHITLCNSEATRWDARSMPLVQYKLRTIPLGVDVPTHLSKDDARKILAPHIASPLWIGSVAELHPNKQLDVLVRAFAHIANDFPDTTLVLVGEGKERVTLEALVRELGLEARVRLRGHVEHAATYMRAFDIFVLPSRTESLGYVLLEAGCATLPVVASNVGGIPEIVKDGETGLLVGSGDVDALARALRTYLTDPALRTRMAEALHAHVTTSFSKERMLRDTLAAY